MKISFRYGNYAPHEPPSFLLEAETDFEVRFLQAHFLRRLRGQAPCLYRANMVLDEATCGTGDVVFQCVDNGLEDPYHWESQNG